MDEDVRKLANVCGNTPVHQRGLISNRRFPRPAIKCLSPKRSEALPTPRILAFSNVENCIFEAPTYLFGGGCISGKLCRDLRSIKFFTMKYLLLLSFVLFTVVSSFAQHDPDKLLYFAKAEKYRRMKNTGTVLAVAGTVLTVVGIVTLVNNSDPYGTTGNEDDVLAGAAAYLIGLGSLGAGIPLWIVGAHNERKYNRKLEDISLNFHIAPQRSGLTFTYRF